MSDVLDYKKKCKGCLEVKSLDLFYTYKNNKGSYLYCKTCHGKRNKENKLKNKDSIDIYNKKYYSKNKEYYKKYRANNVDKYRDYHRNYCANRLKEDPIFKLKRNIRSLIGVTFKNHNVKKSIKSKDILGMDLIDFKRYIEDRFEPWMTWDNHGKYNGELNHGWDLDHIIPISSAKTKDDIIKLNHYSNFQPLCSYTNRTIKKGSTLNRLK